MSASQEDFLIEFRSILDLKLSRNEKQDSEIFLKRRIFMRCPPVTFLTNGIFYAEQCI